MNAVGLAWWNWRRVTIQVFVVASLIGSFSLLSGYLAIKLGAKIDENAWPTRELLFCLHLGPACFAFVPWTLWLLKNAIVGEGPSLIILIKRSWPWLGGSCLLASLCFTDYYIPPYSTRANPQTGIGYGLVTIGIALMLGTILWSAYRSMRQTPGIRRIEIQFFLLNACFACLIVIILNVISRTLHVPALYYASPLIVMTMYGVLVWAVCYHRVFDARQVIISLGQRVAMLAVLSGGALGLTALLSPFVGRPTDLVLGVILAGLLVYHGDQLTRKWLHLDPEHLLAGPRDKIIEWSRTESDPEKLRALFENYLRHWCQTDVAELLTARGQAYAGRHLAFSNRGLVNLCRQGWVTPEHLQRLRPEPAVDESLGLMTSMGLAAVIAVPRGSDSPSLMVALGPKHSLRPYTYPDITLLLTLVDLMDNILSHARLSAHAAKIARMESAAMMSRGLAHDLNNLTTPVSTYLLHCEGRAQAGTAEAEVYDAARHSIRVMQDYIKESLFFARRLVPEFKPVDSEKILLSVVQLARERADRRGIQLRIVSVESIPFTADPVLIQRLALNLVHNAIDASARGARVDISLVSRSRNQICLEVADRGSGIPPENIRRLFDPYFTTKDTGDDVRGIGLGLAISRKIADLHGGEIEARSTPGQGTTFTAMLPRSPHPRAQDDFVSHNPIVSDAL